MLAECSGSTTARDSPSRAHLTSSGQLRGWRRRREGRPVDDAQLVLPSAGPDPIPLDTALAAVLGYARGRRPLHFRAPTRAPAGGSRSRPSATSGSTAGRGRRPARRARHPHRRGPARPARPGRLGGDEGGPGRRRPARRRRRRARRRPRRSTSSRTTSSPCSPSRAPSAPRSGTSGSSARTPRTSRRSTSPPRCTTAVPTCSRCSSAPPAGSCSPTCARATAAPRRSIHRELRANAGALRRAASSAPPDLGLHDRLRLHDVLLWLSASLRLTHAVALGRTVARPV